MHKSACFVKTTRLGTCEQEGVGMCCKIPEKQKARITRIIITAALGILSVGMVACNKGNAAVPNIVTEVLVAQPLQRDVPLQREWVASLDGYVNAEIRPQVSGYIISQNYKEGSTVSKGQVLFQIDPRAFQAALDSAKGELARAQAELGRTTLDVERDTPLAEQKAIAKAQLDTEIQAKLAAQAAVESAKAAVEPKSGAFAALKV